MLWTRAAFGQEMLPAREYFFVLHQASTSSAEVLKQFREVIMRSLRDSAALPAGYPVPCRPRLEATPERHGESVIRCDQSDLIDQESAGVIVDGEGHFVQLSLRDYPDTQVYLFEVYLVRGKLPSRLEAADRQTLARIVVHFPLLEKAEYSALVGLIAKGLIDAGARVLRRQ